MKRLPALALILALSATPAAAVPGGKLGVLYNGPWTCELPGDATSQPVARPEQNFRVVADSSYITTDGHRGTYVRLGNQVQMTSGPFEGQRFVLFGDMLMRKLDDQGHRTALRCVRAGTPDTGADADTGAPDGAVTP